MNVFVAGGSGAIGVPLVRALVAAGHQVTASTRSSANASMLRTLGATPAIADALDAEALRRVVVAAHPTHVNSRGPAADAAARGLTCRRSKATAAGGARTGGGLGGHTVRPYTCGSRYTDAQRA